MVSSLPILSFENFDLRIEPAADGMVRAVVQHSPAGSPYGTPFVVPAILTATDDIFHSGDPTISTLFGNTLFEKVFQGKILQAYEQSKQEAESKGKSLRIRLRFHTSSAFAPLPWELLTPPGQNPLTLSKHTPLVRYLDLLGTPKPLTIRLPLRVLVVIAAPPSLPLLNGDEEWNALHQALAPLRSEGLVELERLSSGTVSDLRRALSSDTPYHVLHYIGHSRFNEALGEGELLLEPENAHQEEMPLSARTFTQLVGEHRTRQSEDPRSFRLIYLNSCQGAVGEGVRASGGIAQTLVEQGMSAVIAMQGYVPNRDAVQLATHFYRAVAEGNPVDAALSIARQTFYTEQSESLSWALPALFLRSDNSYLFALPGQVLPDTAGGTLPPAPGIPPYKGLAYYDLNDYEHFFGRETLTNELIDHLRTTQSLVVVGASGSGKSSVVRAGVLAALLGRSTVVESTRLPYRPDTWLPCVLTPTATPLTSLATALTKDEPSVLAAGQLQTDLEESVKAFDLYLKRRTSGNSNVRFLIVVDQLEELLTLCKDPDHQKRFLEALFYALEHHAPLTLILTLRADFYDKFTAFPVLQRAFEQQQRVVVAMESKALRRAIELPAAQGKWEFETGLVDLLLTDAGNEPGNLPLLSHALHETWLRRSGRTLTFAGYVAAGRIQGAIARTADTKLQTLTPDGRLLAHKVFVELTELGDGTPDTRRRVVLSDLERLSTSPGQLDTLLKTLSDARLITLDRLITLGQVTVEVSHEALIREWSTLREWVAADRDWLRFRRELVRDVQTWVTLNRDAGPLYRKAQLAEALAKTQGRDNDLSATEQEFLTVSQQQAITEQQEKAVAAERAKRNILLTRFAWVLGLLLFVAVVLAAFAYQQRGIAQSAQAEAESARREILLFRLASESSVLISKRGYSLSLLTAIESVIRQRPFEENHTIVPETIEQLYHVLEKTGAIPLEGHEEAISALAFSPDGRWLATGSADNTVKLWQVNNPSAPPISLEGHEEAISELVFSPDGKWLATGSASSEGIGTVKLWEVNNTSAPPITLEDHKSSIYALVFSPDGNWLATGGWDGIVRLLEVKDLSEPPISFQGYTAGIHALAFSPDGKWLATGSQGSEGTVRLLEVNNPSTPPIFFQGSTSASLTLAFSPDGKWLATGDVDSNKLLEVNNPNAPPIMLDSDKSSIGGPMAFSLDGNWLATAGSEGTARLWEMNNPNAPPITLEGREGFIYALAFSPDGQWLATGSSDATAKLWEVNNPDALPITLEGHESSIATLAFSPDGRWLATGSSDATAKLWEVNKYDAPPITLAGHEATINALAFSPDGRWFATGSGDNMAKLWEINNPNAPPITLEGHESSIATLAFSPDGRWLATASYDTTAKLWEMNNLDAPPITLAGHDDYISTLAFSPDGRWLATASNDATAKLWEMNNLDAPPISFKDHEEGINVLAFSPDGNWLATGSGDFFPSPIPGINDNTVKLWEVNNPNTPPITLVGHEATINALAFSPDGRWLATGSDDNMAKLWEINNPDAPPITLAGHDDYISTLAFSPDGRWLATASNDATAKLWEMNNLDAPPISFKDHEEGINVLAFSPDGNWLATGSGDATTKLWAMNNLDAPPITLVSHEAAVNVLAFSPDGKWLATGSDDATTKLWTLLWDELIVEACATVGRNMTRDEWATYFQDEEYRPTCEQWAIPPEE